MMAYCVYAHERASDGRTFYIGKGKNPRAHSKIGRSKRWARTVAKHGLNVRYIKKDMAEPCAFSLEKALIFAIGRENLCNMTDGGEGTSGRLPTQSQRLKCAASNKGRKPAPHSISLARIKNSKPIGTKCGLRYPSATAAAKAINPANWRAAKVGICGCANGKTKHAYGYEWGYLSEGQPTFLYRSKTSNPRPHKWRAVVCGNGMRFDAVAHAVEWLKSIGHEKASTGAICRAAKYSSRSYGLEWRYE